MTEEPAEPAHWVRMRIPPRFELGAQGIADRCGWMLRTTDQPEFYNVALRENYERRGARALSGQKAVTAGQAGEASCYEGFRWTGQDQYLSRDDRQRAIDEANRLAAQNDGVQFWAAVNVRNLVASDDDLPEHLRSFYPDLAAQMAKSSLWAIHVDPVIHSRRAIVRGLLSAEEVPELLERSDEDFQGFEAGKGLGVGIGLGALIQTALISPAPGGLGINTQPPDGSVTLLFGPLHGGPAAELS